MFVLLFETPPLKFIAEQVTILPLFYGHLMDFPLSAVSLSVGRYATITRLSPPNNPKHMHPLTLLRMSGQNNLLGHTR